VGARLTVTGARGLQSLGTVDSRPKVTRLTLKTNPTGIAVSNGIEAGSSPVVANYAWGGLAQLLVPAQATIGGKVYKFSEWSDGSTAGTQREMTVPKADSSRTAKYVLAGTDAKPQVPSYTISPTVVNGLPQTFTVSARATDDIGVASVRIRLTDPAARNYSTSLTRTSGTALDGTWTGSIKLPSDAIGGTYVSAILAKDTAGSQTTKTGATISVTK
jgi:hypothetical protein